MELGHIILPKGSLLCWVNTIQPLTPLPLREIRKHRLFKGRLENWLSHTISWKGGGRGWGMGRSCRQSTHLSFVTFPGWSFSDPVLQGFDWGEASRRLGYRIEEGGPSQDTSCIWTPHSSPSLAVLESLESIFDYGGSSNVEIWDWDPSKPPERLFQTVFPPKVWYNSL